MSALSRQLKHTCTIQQVTETRNAIGGVTKTFTNRATGVACRNVITQEKFSDPESGTLKVTTVHKLMLLDSQTVLQTDQITTIVDDFGTHAGPFTIDQVIERSGPKGAKYKLLVLNE